MSDQNETPSVTHKWRGSSNNKLRKVHVTFDNFAYLRDDTVSWMEPDELAALPVLLADELWENYHRARIAHQAAVDAITPMDLPIAKSVASRKSSTSCMAFIVIGPIRAWMD